jgi:hypothetical protein
MLMNYWNNRPRSTQSLIYMLMCIVTMLSCSLAQAQPIRPKTDRLDAIVSYPIVISIEVDDERSLRNGVETKLDDGRVLVSQPFWVGLTRVVRDHKWTSSRGIWTATPYTSITKIAPNRRPAGSWFIQVPIPIDAVGQGLWFEGTRFELNWLPDPERTMLETNNSETIQTLDEFWSFHLQSDALSDPSVTDAINQYHQDPFLNWRARLLTDGLHPDRARIRDTNALRTGGIEAQSLDALELELALDSPGADLLKALARQHEARWQIILGRIWLINPLVANRLKAQLMQTARFGDRILPVWTSDTTELAQLAHDLLSPFVDDQTRVLRAKAWLEIQPRALAWISDDQGQNEAGSGKFISTLSLLSLPSSPGSTLFRLDALTRLGYTQPVLTTVPGYLVTPASITIDPIKVSPTNPTLDSTQVRIRAARWNTQDQLIASPTPARAPYVRIGPLLYDWTMESLVENRPLGDAKPTAQAAAIGLLRRTGKPTRDYPTTDWQLYFECASQEPTNPNESLTLWIGPYTNPFVVWSIKPTGEITLDAGSKFNIGIPKVNIRVLDDRWIAMIDLPAQVFDQDQVLQLGIERVDFNNTHSAWPRRMVPDQSEPGRLSIEADNFDQLRPF